MRNFCFRLLTLQVQRSPTTPHPGALTRLHSAEFDPAPRAESASPPSMIRAAVAATLGAPGCLVRPLPCLPHFTPAASSSSPSTSTLTGSPRRCSCGSALENLTGSSFVWRTSTCASTSSSRYVVYSTILVLACTRLSIRRLNYRNSSRPIVICN